VSNPTPDPVFSAESPDEISAYDALPPALRKHLVPHAPAPTPLAARDPQTSKTPGEYYHIPLLEELHERGGVPGYVYAIVRADREFPFQRLGLARLPNSQTFKLVGPIGETGFVVMRVTAEDHIPGLPPESGRRICLLDEEALAEATGLRPGDVYVPAETPSPEPPVLPKPEVLSPRRTAIPVMED